MVKEQEIVLESMLAEGSFAFEFKTPVCLELFYISPCLNEGRFEFFAYAFSFIFFNHSLCLNLITKYFKSFELIPSSHRFI